MCVFPQLEKMVYILQKNLGKSQSCEVKAEITCASSILCPLSSVSFWSLIHMYINDSLDIFHFEGKTEL